MREIHLLQLEICRGALNALRQMSLCQRTIYVPLNTRRWGREVNLRFREVMVVGVLTVSIQEE